MTITGALRTLGIAVLVIAGLGAAVLTGLSQFSPSCTRDVIRAQTALGESSRALQPATHGDPTAACRAYRHHLEALEEAKRVGLRCGPPQMTKRAAWPSFEGEVTSYRRLIAERCS